MVRIIPIITFVFLVFQSNFLVGQRMDHLRGDLLIRLKEGASAQRMADRYAALGKPSIDLRPKRLLSRHLNIWRFTYDPGAIGEERLLSMIRADKAVEEVQLNHFVKVRSTTPDDPLFDSQWQYLNTGVMGGVPDADLDMEEAWDLTTGGVTALGDTIVVCVLDGGVDLSHQDFEDNLWVNHYEIPNNGIDDDGNGYVDDVRGWNADANNDNINGDNHGTAVAGIIGAKGNNNLGVSGISWDVKVMVVRTNTGLESEVIAAYDYPLTQRKRYNESNGTEGAFVVATNASWGVDGGSAADAPLWCAFYDTLGYYGILNCGATINSDVDVETFGDLPTTCTSDYLISVTNIKRNNIKEEQAGYGSISIDLGAFGSEVFTTGSNNSYGPFGGTSGATPQVTGSIGLMYSIPCMNIATLARENPEACALLMKEAVMATAVPNTSLEGITVTGGQLNTNDALNYLMETCDGCFRPSVLRASNITDTEALLSWAQTSEVVNADLRWRVAGDSDWTEVMGVEAPYLLTGLMGCLDYEYQVKSNCGAEASEYSESAFFKSDGCCEAPYVATVLDVDASGAMLSWSSVLAATSYLVNFRIAGEVAWNSLLAFDPNYTITGLEPCTEYEFRVETKCGVESGGFTPVQSFRTSDCGACADAQYCNPVLQGVDEDWIEHFVFGDIDHSSGNDSGYGNFSLLGNFVFEKGQIYSMSLEPGYAGFHYSEDLRIWLDLNKNEIFEESEVLYTAPNNFNSLTVANIEIPPNIEPGETRMRVAMMFQEVTGPCPTGVGAFGEFEDYCVEIQEAQSCVPVHHIDTTDLTLTSVILHWTPITIANNYSVAYRKIGDTEFITSTTFAAQSAIVDLEKCSTYELVITTNCTDGNSIESVMLEFNTDCDVGLPNEEVIQEWTIAPNPFREHIRMNMISDQAKDHLTLMVYNQYGQQLFAKALAVNIGDNVFEVSSADWPTGVYFVALVTDDGQQLSVRKVVKM